MFITRFLRGIFHSERHLEESLLFWKNRTVSFEKRCRIALSSTHAFREESGALFLEDADLHFFKTHLLFLFAAVLLHEFFGRITSTHVENFF